MSRNNLITTATPIQDQLSSQPNQAENQPDLPDAAGLEYQLIAPVQTVRIKARVRSIVVGKPLRYDFPNEE